MSRELLPSLKDIATRTGFSIATVSRVLRNKGEIAPATKKHVLEVAEQLGYHDNRLIYAIQTGKTKTVGVALTATGGYFSKILHEIRIELEKHDYLMLLSGTEDEHKTLKRFVEQRVDGIILVSTQDLADNSYFSEILSRGMPIVTIDRKTKAEVDFIGTDDYLGGRLSAEHLYRQGHRSLAYYQGPELATPAHLRKEGFAAFCKEHNDIYLTLLGHGTYDIAHDDTLLQDSLRKNPDITGAAAFYDTYACRLWRAARNCGRNIPDDFSIVGFGDIIDSGHSEFHLTTLNQNPALIARAAVDRLFERIGSEQKLYPVDIRIPPELIVRKSTASCGIKS